MQKPSFSVFNNKYQVLTLKDESKASKVYLGRSTTDSKKLVFLKIYKEEYLIANLKQVETEIQILSGLDHPNVARIIEYGSDGEVIKPSGKKINHLVYTVLEHFSGQTLFELCHSFGKMKEAIGKLFMI
jgi:serine/threonine protein kinase